jgi:hypothetical protein
MNEKTDLKLKCIEIAKQFATDLEDLITKANLLFSFITQNQK